MIIQCTKCLAKFKFDESKLSDGPKKVRCSKCTEVFTVIAPEQVTEPSAPADVPPTASRVPTDYNLLRTPTSEIPAPVASPASPIAPVKVRKNTGDSDSLSTSGKRRTLTPTTPAPRTQPAAAAPSAVLRPSFTTLTSITAQSAEPDAPALEKNEPAQIASTWAARGENPPTPSPNGWSREQASARLSTPAILDPTQAPKPAKQEQFVINDELYKASDRTLELPPLLKVLKEIDFDSTGQGPDDLLELDMGRKFEYGGESAHLTQRGAAPKLIMRPLSGVRDESAPVSANLSKTFSAVVKTSLLLLIFATLIFIALVLRQGDRFNMSDLKSLDGLKRLVASETSASYDFKQP
jgi:predicted Zn finger-like uncharacterized protein